MTWAVGAKVPAACVPASMVTRFDGERLYRVGLPADTFAAVTDMDLLLLLLVASALVFALNIVPAFMPPTWSVLAVTHLTFDVPVLPLVVCAAFSASCGRLALALLSRRYGRALLSPSRRNELTALGRWLDTKARWAAPLALLIYFFSPIPSNQLFVAAGLTRMSLGRVVAAFLAGRLVSYPLWITAAAVTATRLEEVFLGQFTNGVALAVELALVASVVLFARIDWSRLISRFDPTFAPRELV
jgi:membrane protein YqaA with SNARE-associated domain